MFSATLLTLSMLTSVVCASSVKEFRHRSRSTEQLSEAAGVCSVASLVQLKIQPSHDAQKVENGTRAEAEEESNTMANAMIRDLAATGVQPVSLIARQHQQGFQTQQTSGKGKGKRCGPSERGAETDCSSHRCPSRYVNKGGPGCSDGVCCVKSCSFFSCPGGYILKGNSDRIRGNDPSTCCDRTCSGFACANGYISKGASIRGHDQGTCCDKACSGFTCVGGLLNKPNSDRIRGNDGITCCDKACSGFTCAGGYIRKERSTTIAGNDQDICCDKTCSGFACTGGYVNKPDRDSIKGYDRATCCKTSGGDGGTPGKPDDSTGDNTGTPGKPDDSAGNNTGTPGKPDDSTPFNFIADSFGGFGTR